MKSYEITKLRKNCVKMSDFYSNSLLIFYFYKDYKPLIGMRRCWIQPERAPEAIFVYTPISVIILVNICLYSVTAYKIYKVQRETSVIRNGESQKHAKMDADKDR